MLNLFRGWPEDNIAQIYIESATPIPPDFTVCRKYWKLSPWTAIKSHFGLHGWDDLSEQQTRNWHTYSVQAPLWRRFFMKMATLRRAINYIEPARELLFTGKSLLTPELARWILNFRPQVIYSMLGNNIVMGLAIKAATLARIPIVPHFTDDWPSTQYGGSPFANSLRKQMNTLLHEVLAKSSLRLAICDAMAREYELRYGGSFYTFGNCLDCNIFSQQPPPCRETVQLCYVGGLHLSRWETLRQLGMCLSNLDKLGIRAKLKVFTFAESVRQYKQRLFIPPVLELAGSLERDEVPRIMQDADILVHVESFRKEERKYARLSLSTKIPEYLMAGRCILACGPAEAASIRYVQDTHVGVALTSDDPHVVLTGLRRLIVDRRFRTDCGRRAREVGLERHEDNRQRGEFRKRFIEAIE